MCSQAVLTGLFAEISKNTIGSPLLRMHHNMTLVSCPWIVLPLAKADALLMCRPYVLLITAAVTWDAHDLNVYVELTAVGASERASAC